jgi:hypothetical protein
MKRLVLAKLGQLTCRHAYVLIAQRHRLFLRCPICGAESEGFQLGVPKRVAR